MSKSRFKKKMHIFIYSNNNSNNSPIQQGQAAPENAKATGLEGQVTFFKLCL